MGDNTIKNNWKYFLFKKKYPVWVYTIILSICAIAMYIWIQYLANL